MELAKKKLLFPKKKNIKFARKVLVANRLIKKGEIFTSENLAVKRAGAGISPMSWNKFIFRKSKHNYKKDEKIK